MPQLGSEVEAFLTVVWNDKVTLLQTSTTLGLRKRLYDLYTGAAGTGAPSITNDKYLTIIQGLEKLLTKGVIHHSGSLVGGNEAYLPGGFMIHKNGFYEFHGGSLAMTSTSSEGWRVYVNTQAKYAAVLGRSLLDLLHQGRAVYFKFADDPAEFDARADGVVIYTDSEIHANEIVDLLAPVGQTFLPGTPFLTEKWLNGVGVCQDPDIRGENLSFGQHRVLPFAMAMRAYRGFARGVAEAGLSDEQGKEIFRVLLKGAFEAYKLDHRAPARSTPAMDTRGKVSAKADTDLPSKVLEAATALLHAYAKQRVVSVRDIILQNNLTSGGLV